MKVRVAVYGTLKKGCVNHDQFLSTATPLGAEWIRNFALKMDGKFPMAFEFDDCEILCEMYEVDVETMQKIDTLEGLKSGWYRKYKIKTKFGECFLYGSITSKMVKDADKWIPDGIWIGQTTPKMMWLGWETERDIVNRRIAEGLGRLSVSYQPAATDNEIESCCGVPLGKQEDATQEVIPFTGPPAPLTRWERTRATRDLIAKFDGDRLLTAEM